MGKKISDASPAEKLLGLYTFLMFQGKRYTSLTELARRFQCSKQTILRLLVQIEASNYGKLAPPLKEGKEHLYRMASMSAASIDFGLKELAGLARCRTILLSLLPSEIAGLLSENLEAENARQATEDNVIRFRSKGRIDYSKFEEQYSIFIKAIKKQKVCFVGYRKNPLYQPREFFFVPQRILSFRESLLVTGYEVDNGEKPHALYANPLSLYLQRCEKVNITNKSGANTPRVMVSSCAFGIMEGETFTVKLLFSANAAAYVYDREWSDEDQKNFTEDGQLLLTMKSQSKPEIISWVQSFGPNVRVIEPEWLAERIMNDAAKVLEKYK